NQAENELLQLGATVIWISENSEIKGLLAFTDTVRAESLNIVSAIKKVGLKVMLLTGDHEKAARQIAEKVEISEIKWGLLPDEKVLELQKLQNQGHLVAMAGDGLNDAPAMKAADVGVAMGGIGSDLTVEAADVALLSGTLSSMPYLILLARKTIKTIRFNIALALIINFIALILAALGLMGPAVSALVHNLGAIIVVINATRLYHFKGLR
ncbi:MAG: HAD-IC family P-type ATPase, partial [Candidatus Adiutrix sp.]